ncbi:hypothetical protein D3C76_958920 [compost metagenome]
MLTVQIDEDATKDFIKQRIFELVNAVDAELVFWDTNELKRRTCMSIESIHKSFFYDSRFPKHKIGGKWYFPARETRRFLELWLEEQSC